MIRNGLTNVLFQLNSFKAIMKIKKLWLLPQSLLSKPHGVTIEKDFLSTTPL